VFRENASQSLDNTSNRSSLKIGITSIVLLQQFANTHSMRNEIINLMIQKGIEDDCYIEMLDYTIDLFESQGLGTDYYGYHNINHELEVTYFSLLSSIQNKVQFTDEDIKYLYVAALFNEFDP